MDPQPTKEMPAILIAQLLVQFGLPLTQQIFAWAQDGKTVTPEMFALLVTLGQYRSADALTAAGIQIIDGKVAPLGITAGLIPPPEPVTGIPLGGPAP